jgi:hypothetical protein
VPVIARPSPSPPPVVDPPAGLGDRLIEVVVDDELVVDAGPLDQLELAPGLLEAAPDGRLFLAPASAEPCQQRLLGRGQDEHEERLGHRLPHLHAALNVDLQDYEPTLGELPLDRPPRRAVPVPAEDLGPLEEVTGRPPRVELLVGEEVVVAPLDVGVGLRPRRRRHAEDAAEPALDLVRDRGLPDPGRSGDDDEQAPLRGLGHGGQGYRRGRVGAPRRLTPPAPRTRALGCRPCISRARPAELPARGRSTPAAKPSRESICRPR